MSGPNQLFLPAIPPDILAAVEVLTAYFGSEDSWMTFKKELLRSLKPEQRTVFSTRDPLTKAQTTNDLEKAIIFHWLKTTGVLLKL